MMLSKPLSIKKGCYICQWLDNVDMHLYAKFDQNISCVSSVMSIYSLTEDGHTDCHSDYSLLSKPSSIKKRLLLHMLVVR